MQVYYTEGIVFNQNIKKCRTCKNMKHVLIILRIITSKLNKFQLLNLKLLAIINSLFYSNSLKNIFTEI